MSTQSLEPPVGSPVVVNGQTLSAATLQLLQQRVGPMPAGRWWYDACTGAWGPEGGPTAGWVAPCLPLPGPLRANASGGGHGALTGVFINGRELHPQDVIRLHQALGKPVWHGRWWADALGRFGPMLAGFKLPAINNLAAAPATQADQTWSLSSADGRQFLGSDSDGVSFATGSRGEAWFGE